MLAQVMAGRGAIANGVVPPVLDGYDPNRKPYPHDIAKAKQLLAAAGYPNGIDVELWASTTDQSPRISQTLQANLAEAGIRAKIVQRDASSMREASRSGKTDLALKDGGPTIRSRDFLYPLLHSRNKGAAGNGRSTRTRSSTLWSTRRFASRMKRSATRCTSGRSARIRRRAMSIFFSKDLYAVQPDQGFSNCPPSSLASAGLM